MEDGLTTTIRTFFRDGQRLNYSKGQVVITAEQDPPGVLWLSKGVVEQYTLSRDGVRVSLNMFKPPAFFPMAWAMTGTANAYFYSAVEEVELYLRSATDTLAFLEDNPKVIYDLLTRVYRGSEGLLQRIALANSRAVTERIVFELTVECYRFGQELDGGWWQVTITQVGLASRSGLARETVSRELKKLAEQGLVVVSKGMLRVNVAAFENPAKG